MTTMAAARSRCSPRVAISRSCKSIPIARPASSRSASRAASRAIAWCRNARGNGSRARPTWRVPSAKPACWSTARSRNTPPPASRVGAPGCAAAPRPLPQGLRCQPAPSRRCRARRRRRRRGARRDRARRCRQGQRSRKLAALGDLALAGAIRSPSCVDGRAWSRAHGRAMARRCSVETGAIEIAGIGARPATRRVFGDNVGCGDACLCSDPRPRHDPWLGSHRDVRPRRESVGKPRSPPCAACDAAIFRRTDRGAARERALVSSDVDAEPPARPTKAKKKRRSRTSSISRSAWLCEARRAAGARRDHDRGVLVSPRRISR